MIHRAVEPIGSRPPHPTRAAPMRHRNPVERQNSGLGCVTVELKLCVPWAAVPNASMLHCLRKEGLCLLMSARESDSL